MMTASESAAASAALRRARSGHVTFYVEVPDVEAALAKAERLGGTRPFGPDKVPGTETELGQFTDPEGNVIGLMHG
jgi:uncharacterized protein